MPDRTYQSMPERKLCWYIKVKSDLLDFFGPIISGMMALHKKGRADEKEQIVAALREAERTSVAEAAKKNLGIP